MTRRILYPAAGLLVVALLAVVYFTYDPSQSGWFPHCPWLVLTGWECPGCGSQRAIHSLLHGDIAAAWRHNALAVAAMPALMALAVLDLGRARWPRIYAKVNGYWITVTIAAVLIGWGVLRNIL